MKTSCSSDVPTNSPGCRCRWYCTWSGLDVVKFADSGSNEVQYNTDKWPSKVINNALAMLYVRDQILEKKKTESKMQLVATESSTATYAPVYGISTSTGPAPQVPEREFSRVLGMNRGTNCYWPHDRVYSILGIASERFRSSIKVSYTPGVETFYSSSVKDYVFVTRGYFDIILQSQHNLWHNSIPSWTPDWAKEPRAAVFHHDAYSSWLLSQVFIDKPSAPCLSEDLKRLTLRAVAVGELTSIGLEFKHILEPAQPYYDCERQDPPCPKITRPIPRQTFIWWERRDDRASDILEALADLVPGTHPVWRHHIEANLCAFAVTCIPSARPHLPDEILKLV